MTWYAAHIIMYTKFNDGVQENYPVWENVVMIEAASSDEAYDKADRKGEAEAESSVSEGYTYDGRPATWVFAGVRKLNECIEHFDPTDRSKGSGEEDGTEVTYSSFLVESETALRKLVANENVSLIYEGRNDDIVNEAS